MKRLREQSLDNPDGLGGFLHRTAVNIWIGHARKEKRRKTDPDSEQVDKASDRSTDQHALLEQQKLGAALRLVLEEMAVERDKELLRRFYLLDQPKDLVCDALELSPANFDRVLYRAKQRFRQSLESSNYGHTTNG